MQISFHGAAREVTGSCYLVETANTRVLVDCGMFQGSAFADAKNFREFSFDPKTVQAVIITHAHLDHIGRLPLLAKRGFRGKVYATPPTAPLMRIVLNDAEQIMEEDFKREYRPKLYERADVDTALKGLQTVDYGARLAVGDVVFRFQDAGHIFGSAFVEIEERGGSRVVFSGDVGNRNEPILRPTDQLGALSALVIESTYGNRFHEDESQREAKLREAIIGTVKRNGVLIIPAFAVERTQEVLYELNDLVERKGLPPVDIYLDSPMAIEVSEVIRDFPEYYGSQAAKLTASGDDIFAFKGLHLCKTRDDSRTINDAPRPKVIISGAGMMNGGRIRHHLIRYLGDKRSTVLIIGYQAAGTLGRKLYTGERTVEIFGERINVKASVTSIGAYSAHADQRKLLSWVGAAKQVPEQIFCTHGDEGAAAALATRLTEEYSVRTSCPRFLDTVQV